MRSKEDVLNAKNRIQVESNAVTVQSLPPAYMKGLILSVNDENQLVVSAGVGNIRGQRTVQKEPYIIQETDFTVPDHVIGETFYTVYLSTALEYKVDIKEPVRDDQFYAYYHPIDYRFRYIGQFYLTASRKFQKVISYDPLGFNTVATYGVDSLLLSVKEYLSIGYTGDGNLQNPAEGDNYMYIDGDEIQVLEYAGGAWIEKLKIGGKEYDYFVAQFKGNTINHIGNTLEDNREPFPTKNFKVFSFNSIYTDQYGEDDWTGKTNVSFTAVWSKHWTASLSAITNTTPTLSGPQISDVGDDISAACYVNASPPSTTHLIGLAFFSVGFDYIGTWLDGSTDEIIFIFNRAGSTNSWEIPLSQFGEWSDIEYLGFSYDATNDIIHYVVNDKIYTYTDADFSGSWSVGNQWEFSLRPRYNTTTGYHIYFSELLISYEDYINPQIIVEHYNHDTPWTTVSARADQSIYCAPGGRIRFFDHMPDPSLGTLHMIPADDRDGLIINDTSISTTWELADLSAYVPFGTTAVLLRFGTSDDAGWVSIYLRALGQTDNTSSNTEEVRLISAAYYGLRGQVIVMVSPDGSFQYRGSASSTNQAISFSLRGYWI